MISIPANVTDMTNDSRQVKPGSLFIAYPGAKVDGRQYIKEVIAKGAVAVFYDPNGASAFLPEMTAVPLIPIENLAHHQSAIAAQFYDHPSRTMRMVGVTGTNGKTSITQFVAKSLQSLDSRCAVVGTLGCGIYPSLDKTSHTTPDPILLQKILHDVSMQRADTVAMEVSSHSLEQRREAAVQFDVAVFTNLTRDHLDYHGDMQTYGRAKQRLFEHPELKAAVINIDDEFGKNLATSSCVKKIPQCITYSLHNREAVIFVESIIPIENGFDIKVRVGDQSMPLTLPLLGRFNISNSMAVLGVLMALGYAFPQAIKAISNITPVDGRMQLFVAQNFATVVVDYSHTPDALMHALQALRDHCRGQLWCVFGCGGDRDRGKRSEMGAIAEKFSDQVILTNDNPRSELPMRIINDIQAGFKNPQAVQILLDREKAIQQAVHQAGVDDVILIAGKGHEDYQIIGDKTLTFSDSIVVQQQLQLLARNSS